MKLGDMGVCVYKILVGFEMAIADSQSSSCPRW
jgi:hypothetical protein